MHFQNIPRSVVLERIKYITRPVLQTEMAIRGLKHLDFVPLALQIWVNAANPLNSTAKTDPVRSRPDRGAPNTIWRGRFPCEFRTSLPEEKVLLRCTRVAILGTKFSGFGSCKK